MSPPASPATAQSERPSFEADPSRIRRAHPVPYYAQLAEIIREAIATGVWHPGELIPSEADLGDFFGISRTVVRQALNELVADGLVYKEKGRGTFVSQPKVADLVVHEIRGFVEEMSARGTLTTSVLTQEVTGAPTHVARALSLNTDARTIHLTRVRSIDGEPIVKVDTWLPMPRFADVLDAPLDDASLYEVLADRYGVRPCGGWRRLEAALAGRALADDLGIGAGVPIVVLTAVTTDEDDTPFEYFRASYRGDRTSFEFTVGTPTASGDRS